MADYERTIIGFSLDDVIHILEHEPVQPDMVPEITNLKDYEQGTNRATGNRKGLEISDRGRRTGLGKSITICTLT